MLWSWVTHQYFVLSLASYFAAANAAIGSLQCLHYFITASLWVSMFRRSKFCNIGAVLPKRDHWYVDLRPSHAENANCIAASAKHVAIVWDTRGGGSVGFLRLNEVGKREGVDVPLLHAASGL